VPGANLNVVLRHLRRLRGTGRAEDSDGSLLQRFSALRDEAAFTELLRRHGPMVLGVCRRVLGDGPDADDAFQAAFLVLVRRAASVRNLDSLGSFLYGVALRVARKARVSAARRRAHERQASPIRLVDDLSAVVWRDLRPVLDEELERLPEKYRAPMVLCYLEGRTHDEAARQLGWTNGTVCGRLARARDLLRKRLVRRGLAPAVAAVGILSGDVTVAAPLLDATLKAALACAGAAGMTGAVSAPVAALTKEVLNAMFWGKVKGTLLVLLTLCVLIAGAGSVAHQVLIAKPVERVAEEDGKSPALDKGQSEVDAAVPGEPLPPGALARLGTTRLRHDRPVVAVVFSGDGKNLITTCFSRKIHFWDATTGKQVRSVDDEMGNWGCLALSPDGKTLAVGSATDDIRKPDGSWISLRNAQTGKEVRRLAGRQMPYLQMTFSPDSKMLASVDRHAVILWDVSTGQKLRELTEHNGEPYGAVFSPDGVTLATCGEDGTVRFWETASGKAVGELPKQERFVYTLAFAPDGKTLATSSFRALNRDDKLGSGERASVLKLWDVAGRKEIGRLEGHTKGHVWSMAFTLDGKMLASVGGDNTVRLWDVDTWKQIRQFDGGPIHGHRLALSPDGKTLAFNSGNYVRLWDVTSGKEPDWPIGPRTPVQLIAYSPDGKTLASTSEEDRSVYIWDVKGKQLQRLPGFSEAVRRMTFADDKTLLTESEDNTVCLWDAATGKELLRLSGGKDVIYATVFSPDGDTMAVAYRSGIRLFSRKTGHEIRQLPNALLSVQDVAHHGGMSFSPDGKILAVARHAREDEITGMERGGHTTASLWDVATGEELHRLSGPRFVRWLGSAADRPTLVLAPKDEKGGLAVWDVVAAKAIRRIPLAKNLSGARTLFSADGRFLATADANEARLELWDVSAGRRIAVCQGPPDWKPEDRSLACWFDTMTFAPDGRSLATANHDGSIQLWEVGTGQEVRRWGEPKRSRKHPLGFASDGRTITSADGETILIWDVTGRAKADGMPRIELKPKQFEALWDDLNGANVSKSHQALWALVAAGEQAVPIVRMKLRPDEAGSRRAGKLIADLDADSFAAREQATAELEKLGLSAETPLRQALEKQPSLETRRRIETLLEKIDGQGYARLARALQVLEQIGTPEARKALEELAKGPRELRLAREAQASLERLAK
jgi:RNA polymerase sigma factor (sigma-70 family)